MKHWYYNPITLEETFTEEMPEEGWKEGRIPHELWSEDRKQSYASKHGFNPLSKMAEEDLLELRNKHALYLKGRVWITNGVDNKMVLQGTNLPEGWWYGLTFDKTELYKATRTGRARGSKNKWQRK